MAVNVDRESIPSLPDQAHHPSDKFVFPKRSFGKSKPVLCSCQINWFKTWPFLHYDENEDVVFCNICVRALNEHADYKKACPGQLRPDATGKWRK